MDDGGHLDRRHAGDRLGRVVHRAVMLLTVTALTALAAGCAGDDRPSDADWEAEWTRVRTVVPTADELLEGGQPLCDELVGEFRQVLPSLTPTPTEALDGSVTDWVDLAESIAFDCSRDRTEIERRYDELYVLEAEIDAGLRTDSG